MVRGGRREAHALNVVYDAALGYPPQRTDRLNRERRGPGLGFEVTELTRGSGVTGRHWLSTPADANISARRVYCARVAFVPDSIDA